MNKKNRVDEFVKNPKKALFKLAWPIIIAMLVQVMYNIVDTAFVGRLGTDAIAALTFAFPLFFVLMALNGGIAIGMASRISRFLGAKDKKGAENAAFHGLVLSVVIGVIIMIIGLSILKPFFTLLGANKIVMDLAIQYTRIILIGVVFMFPAFVLNNMFSAQGDTKTPMKVQITALIINAVLDPIFIYGLKMGVRGAALATLTSFFFSFMMLLYLTKNHSYLHISYKNFHFRWKLVRQIATVGMPASLAMLLISVYIMFINRFMAYFGTEYVAAFGLASRLETLAVMPIIAIAISTMTLVGMFFGAKRFDLLKSSIWYSLKLGICFTTCIAALLYVFSPLFFRIFTSDFELIKIAVDYLRISVFTYPLMAIAIIISRSMQGMGYGLPGLIINLIRIIIAAIPLAYIFVFVLGYGYLSIAVAMIIGAVLASIIAIIWLEYELLKFRANKS